MSNKVAVNFNDLYIGRSQGILSVYVNLNTLNRYYFKNHLYFTCSKELEKLLGKNSVVII